jgi:4-amino-4-deoxy-L-arabinose transferase-like glycosyltransferase
MTTARPLDWARRHGPELAVAVLVLAFVAITGWWLAEDSRVPEADSAAHMAYAFSYLDGFQHGDPWRWFTAFDIYPPLVHLVGAAAAAIFGIDEAGVIMTQNLVFVPLLALGCYGTGRVAYDRRVGALAAAFALGTPVVVDQFHSFMLDTPEAALVAVVAWLTLAADRFRRLGVCAALGLAIGLGLLTKNTFPPYVAGILVALLRGGWRRPLGVAVAAVVALVVAAPWYLEHLADQAVFVGGAAASFQAGYNDPPNLAPADWTYYLWTQLNIGLYLPLFLFAAAGVIAVVVRVVRTRRLDDPGVDLLAGLVVGYGVTVASIHNDARYMVPLVVYLAVLGTAWFARAPRRLVRVGGTVALLAVVLANLTMTSSGRGPHVAIAVQDRYASYVGSGHAEVLSPVGHVTGGPKRGGDLAAVLRAVHDAGGRRIKFEVASIGVSTLFNGAGATLLAERMGGLKVVTGDGLVELGDRDVLAFRRADGAAGAPPCAAIGDGTGVYLRLGADLRRPGGTRRLYCPTRVPATYEGGAYEELSPIEPEAAPITRDRVTRLLRAARAGGARQVAFHPSVADMPGVRGPEGAALLAERAGLRTVPWRDHARLGPRDLFVFRRPLRAGDRACLELEDGTGIATIRGPRLAPIVTGRPYCP